MTIEMGRGWWPIDWRLIQWRKRGEDVGGGEIELEGLAISQGVSKQLKVVAEKGHAAGSESNRAKSRLQFDGGAECSFAVRAKPKGE